MIARECRPQDSIFTLTSAGAIRSSSRIPAAVRRTQTPGGQPIVISPRILRPDSTFVAWPVAWTTKSHDDALEKFVAAAREHIDYEQQVVWPRFESAVSQDELERLGQQLEQPHKIVSTRPHPHTSSSSIVQKTMGVVAATVDRVVDAATGRDKDYPPDPPKQSFDFCRRGYLYGGFNRLVLETVVSISQSGAVLISYAASICSTPGHSRTAQGAVFPKIAATSFDVAAPNSCGRHVLRPHQKEY